MNPEPSLIRQTAFGKRDEGKRTASLMRDLAGHAGRTGLTYDRRGVALRKPFTRGAAMAAKHGACVAALRWIKRTKGSVMKKRISESRNASKRHSPARLLERSTSKEINGQQRLRLCVRARLAAVTTTSPSIRVFAIGRPRLAIDASGKTWTDWTRRHRN